MVVLIGMEVATPRKEGKAGTFWLVEKNTNSLQPPSDQLILTEYLPLNPLSQVTEFKK